MMVLVLLGLGLVTLVGGAELLVRGASRLAEVVGVPPLVVGLTIVAFGTSAPELTVSVSAALSGQADIALGNVVGSNIFNVLFILGVSALIVPLAVHQKLIWFDVPVMIAVSLLVTLLGLDGRIGRLEGGILFAGLLVYTTWCIVAGRRESADVQQEYAAHYASRPTDAAASPSLPAVALVRQIGLIAIGLILLVSGSRWFVQGAVELARWLGVGELMIGLTVVAGGTSLPEVATSVVAALRGERDIAVGNVVGSNMFNLLGVLGLAAAIGPEGVAVAPQAIQFDLPVMIGVATACLPIFFTGHLVARWEGGLFFAYYIAYIAALVLMSTGSVVLPAFRLLMIGFIIPLTSLTLLVVVAHAYDRHRWAQSRQRWTRDDRSRPQVVIVGGGFGGLSVVRRLAGVAARIVLVDRRNFHLFQPLLYQVATGSLSPANVAVPLRALLRKQWNAAVRLAEATGFDLRAKTVRLDNGELLRYDLLVVAAGARHAYFGHPDWEAAAPGLKTIEDATEMRRRILAAFERAERETDPHRRSFLLTFVIVGGGPTGVELAGALAEIARHTLQFEFRAINPSDARILLVELADRILGTYPASLARQAHRALNRLGVTVRTRSRVADLHDTGLTLVHEGREEAIQAHTILWAAGVEASPLATALAAATGAQTDRAGRIRVGPDLTLPGHPEVFVIGDMADCRDRWNQPIPGIAPVAIQQGRFVAREIRRRVRSRPKPVRSFRYRGRGNLATVGRSAAVADFGWLRMSGFSAWVLWLAVHLSKLSLFQNRLLVLIQWTWSFVTFGRAARLITEQNRPGVDATRRGARSWQTRTSRQDEHNGHNPS